MPQGEVRDSLRDLVGCLSRRFATPAFEPHITLLGGIRLEKGELLPKCSSLAAEAHPLHIRLVKPGFANEFFRSFFIEVERSAALLRAHKRALELFKMQENQPYYPHFSLLYGEVAAEQKQALVGKLRQAPEGFSVSSLDIFEIAGHPKDWRRVARFSLES